mgnify:CR=1 FL=1
MTETKKTYRAVASGNWLPKVKWCNENLHPGGHYEPKWYTSYPFIVFEDEKEYRKWR